MHAPQKVSHLGGPDLNSIRNASIHIPEPYFRTQQPDRNLGYEPLDKYNVYHPFLYPMCVTKLLLNIMCLS